MSNRYLALVLAGALAASGSATQAADISGAGATFPAPVYAKWAETYKRQTGVGINYQPIGSGGGIKQIKAGTVVFGASDKPLKAEDLAVAGLVQFPTVVGGVVPVVNLPGVKPGQIRMTGPILSDVYRGVIKRWDHPSIAAANRGAALPKLPITVVHRSDGSGTTFLFTSYLSLTARNWASGPGASDSVAWPTGIGGKGNDGVAAMVRQTPGAIGYVEYAFAKQTGMTYALMRNKAGAFVAPTAEAFAAATAGANWAGAPGYYLLLLNQPGTTAWPITGATFILVHKKPEDPAATAAALRFFDWAYRNGDGAAGQLDYVPMPAAVKSLVRRTWTQVKGADGWPVYGGR